MASEADVKVVAPNGLGAKFPGKGPAAVLALADVVGDGAPVGGAVAEPGSTAGPWPGLLTKDGVVLSDFERKKLEAEVHRNKSMDFMALNPTWHCPHWPPTS